MRDLSEATTAALDRKKQEAHYVKTNTKAARAILEDYYPLKDKHHSTLQELHNTQVQLEELVDLMRTKVETEAQILTFISTYDQIDDED